MSETINVNNLVEIKRRGLQALKEALGPVGMVRFIQQYENGNGDYTKEKYRNISVEYFFLVIYQ
ncbi:MAG: hypothetical protein LBG58_09545 [Planctomycetaceae bacterium]|nr:hypothetical protein [Planctomycetaceae bacterium]